MLGVALRDTGLTIGDLQALARAADDLGYGTIWLPEVGSRDAITLAAVLGSHTRKVHIGTGVVPVYSRSAVSVSLAAAAAAEATNGRFVLGLGTGHRHAAESWFGGDWKHPRQRLRETVEVVREILSGKRVSHNGEVRVDGFHLGSTPPPVPIYIAALTPPSLRLAGEVADGLLLNWLPPEAVERCALLAREAAADAGRKLKVLGYVRVAVVDDDDERRLARTAMREHTYGYVHLPAYANALRQHGHAQEIERIESGDEKALDSLVESLCLVGDVEEVRDGLARYQNAGLDQTVVYPVGFGDTPAESILRTLRSLLG